MHIISNISNGYEEYSNLNNIMCVNSYAFRKLTWFSTNKYSFSGGVSHKIPVDIFCCC